MKYLSFPLAIAIHIAIFFLVATFQDQNTDFQLAETKNLINMNFSTGHSGGKLKIGTSSPVNQKKSLPISSNATQLNTGSSNTIATEAESSAAGFESSVTSYKEPVYPKMAIHRGIEGKVLIRLKVSSEGIPLETQIVSSSGDESLDQAATLATKGWRFKNRSGLEHYFVEKNIIFQLKN